MSGQTQTTQAKQLHVEQPGGEPAPKSLEKKPSQDGQYRLLLDSIYDAVLIATFSGRIVDTNPRAMEFLLYDRAELCALNVMDVVVGADSKLLSSIVENLADRKYTLVSAFCTRKDGSRFPVEVAISGIVGEGENKLCCSIRDLTVRAQAERALKEALQRLEERDRARLLLVSNVSHELRTPVTSMTYEISNLLKGTAGPVPDSIKPHLERFQRDSRRLLITANEILDLETIEARTITLSRRKTSLDRLLARSIDALSLHARHKGLELVLKSTVGRIFIDCDALKMDRVLQNIIGNAIKYTQGGGRIEVLAETDTGRYKSVVVKVVDTGIGIPAHSLRNVMERYYRVGSQAEGAGLGLSIAREIVELHGGKIDIRSPPAGRTRGTMVSVSLQVTEAPTCLIVSKDASVVEELRKQLGSCGYLVETAGAAKEAFERIGQKQGPDALIVDLALQDMDGIQMVAEMRADDFMRKVPVLMATRLAPEESKREVLRNLSVRLFSGSWTESDLLDGLDDALVSARARED